MPRIIAGEWRGRRIQTLAGERTRPTADRVKEALFSIVGEQIVDAVVLDLFAGSGQIAFEALSRGARHAFVVEQNAEARRIIRRNIELLNADPRITLLPGDAKRAMKLLLSQKQLFNFIYIDPPWVMLERFLRDCGGSLAQLLDNDGLLVTESGREQVLPDNFDSGLNRFRSCRYGTGVLSFYQYGRAKEQS